MFSEIDLRALAERQGPERAFVSVYLSGPDATGSLEQRARNVRRLLSGDEAELEHFEQNMALVQGFLANHSFEAKSLALFACWADDYFEAFPMERSVGDLLWVDSSPYIRPIAELQDEYENYVVVAADNTDAHVYFVTSSVADDDIRVKGDVKNRVKVGGWSQKRYQRRREKELQEYAKDVANAVAELDEREHFDRLFLVGAREAMDAIKAALPTPIADKLAGEETVDLSDEDALWRGAYNLYWDEERASEEALWERIKAAYLQNGPAVVGAEEVLKAAAVGRVDAMIVTRDAKLPAIRCRACTNLSHGTPEKCPVCGETDVYKVDLVNELVELLATSSSRTEFSDAIPSLTEVGDVAALLRY